MNLEEALKQLVDDVVKEAESVNALDTLEYTPGLQGKSRSFDIGVDGNGNGHYSTSVQGLAFVIKKNVKAVLNCPNGIFDIHVISSAGTNQTFNGICMGQEIGCTLKIKGKTTISIDLHSSVPNTTVKGTLSF